MTSTSAESKQFIERYLQALSGKTKTADLVAKYVSDPALVAHITDIESAFPAYELVAEDLIAEDNRVALRGFFRGVHRSAFAGVPPTGQLVSEPVMIVYRIEDGRIAEHWLHFNGASLVAQLQRAAAQAPA